MNSNALKNACASKWKNTIIGSPRQNLHIISPNCESVDNATIFFPSFSRRALSLAISIVILPKTANKLKLVLVSHGVIRIKT